MFTIGTGQLRIGFDLSFEQLEVNEPDVFNRGLNNFKGTILIDELLFADSLGLKSS